MRAAVAGAAVWLLAGVLGCGGPPKPCNPATCASLGKNCGQVSDLCGGTLECGSCPEGQLCGDRFTQNVCSPAPCRLTTCFEQGKDCGVMPDGCGGVLHCGECLQPWPNDSLFVCGGGRLPNVCGIYPCVPASCTAQGKNCGLVSDGCGAVFRCGVCTFPATCGGGGVANVCGQAAVDGGV